MLKNGSSFSNEEKESHFSQYKVQTEALVIQKEYASRAGDIERPIYTKELLVETMKAFLDFHKQFRVPPSPQIIRNEKRSKNIVIEESK